MLAGHKITPADATGLFVGNAVTGNAPHAAFECNGE